MDLPVLFRRDALVLFEYAEEVFYIVVTDCFRNLIHFPVRPGQQFFGFSDPHLIQVIYKFLVCFGLKQLA